MKNAIKSILLILCSTASSAAFADPWTGAFVGLKYQSSTNVTDNSKPRDPMLVFEKPDDIDIRSFGLSAGYRHNIGNVVLGGRFEFLSGTFTTDFDDPSFEGADFDVDTIRLGAELGLPLGRFMPYIVAGFERLSSSEENNNGHFYGLGLNYSITDNWIGGLEYTHSETDFDDERFTGSLDANYIGVSISYKF